MSRRRRGSVSETLDLLAIATGAGAGFVAALWMGFRLTDEPMPESLEEYHILAIIILGFALGFLLYRLVSALVRGHSRRGARREALRTDAEWQASERARVAALRNDPVRQVYAERIDRGEHWSDAQIAYDLDPEAIATCTHLAPIERALRAAGLSKLQYGRYLRASCTIDEARLRAEFTIEEPVWYGLVPDYSRSYEDPPTAAIGCRAHEAVIWVVEESQAKPETPRFPA